jgi:hypothetical protein
MTTISLLTDAERNRIDQMTEEEMDATEGHDALAVACRMLELNKGKTMVRVPTGLQVKLWDERTRTVVD